MNNALSPAAGFGLFEAIGIEIEYMIVDASDLDVRPVAERLLQTTRGRQVSELRVGPLHWSNELVAHVIELKTAGPAVSTDGLSDNFAAGVRLANERLAAEGARLLPGGVHPWMCPTKETRLWPHGSSRVYRAFDRIFNCRGHGWSNLQSMHINLPFNGDEEFGRLHAAVRFLLPLLPALAASSPFLEGKPHGYMDLRLCHYRTNAAAIPVITGQVVPEPAFNRKDYRRVILKPIYDALRPLDPDGILRHEWVNARGAIARFERNTIEIRLLDSQECPRADLAVAGLIVATLRDLVSERWSTRAMQGAWTTDLLAALLERTVKEGDRAQVDADYGRMLGLNGTTGDPAAGTIWRHLTESLLPSGSPDREPLDLIARRGCLARRLLDAAGSAPSHQRLKTVYARLADCLARNEPFVGRQD